MSDISLLSKYYQAIVDVSDRINESVIILRKKSLSSDSKLTRKHKNLIVSKQASHEAKTILLDFLKKLSAVIENKDTYSDLPSFLLEDFLNKTKSEPYFWSDLEQLTEALSENKILTAKHFATLDRLLSIIDIDRMNVFRKLRSRVG
jgi:hypothetical protein